MAVFTAARITAFKPGASPPPVKIPIRFMVLLKKIQKTFTECSIGYLSFHLCQLIKQSYPNLTIFLARNRIYSYNDSNGKHIYTITGYESYAIPRSHRGRARVRYLVQFHATRSARQGRCGWLRHLSPHRRAFLSHWRSSIAFVCALYR